MVVERRRSALPVLITGALALGACARPSEDPAGFRVSAKVAEALPETVRRALEGPSPVRLLSLDPYERALDPAAWESRGYDSLPSFHDYAVLGETTLDEATRRRVVQALYDGIDASDGRVAACFNPRHGLSAPAPDGGAGTVDLVICFECLSLQAYVDGAHATNVLTTAGPEATFTEALRAAAARLPDR